MGRRFKFFKHRQTMNENNHTSGLTRLSNALAKLTWAFLSAPRQSLARIGSQSFKPEGISLAGHAGTRVILNLAPAQPLPASLQKNIHLLTPDECEAELLAAVKVNDEKGASKAVDKLLSSRVQNVIVTMGSRGALVAGNSLRDVIPAFKNKAVDSTGADDIFNGALAVALVEGKSLLDAARLASAAISVGRLGAQSSAPARNEIEQLLIAGNTLGPSKPAERRERFRGRRIMQMT